MCWFKEPPFVKRFATADIGVLAAKARFVRIADRGQLILEVGYSAPNGQNS